MSTLGVSCQNIIPNRSVSLSGLGVSSDCAAGDGPHEGRLRGLKAKHRRLLKTFKAKQEITRFDIDADYNLDRIRILAERALIGRFEYTSGTKLEITEWVNRVWVPLTGMAPRINLLPNRWFLFTFSEAAHLDMILSTFWEFKRVSLFIKRWHLNFDPLKENQTLRHIWMLIPGLPIELWTEDVIKGIADSVGRFVRFDKQNLFGMDRRYAKVMVEIDLKGGLPTEVVIAWGARVWNQTLDFFMIPFRCFLCRKIGHVRASCPYSRKHSRTSSASEISTPRDGLHISSVEDSGKLLNDTPLNFPDLSNAKLAFIESSEQMLSCRISKGEVQLRHDMVTGLPVSNPSNYSSGSKVGRKLFDDLDFDSNELGHMLPRPVGEVSTNPNPGRPPSDINSEKPSQPPDSSGVVPVSSVICLSDSPLNLSRNEGLNLEGQRSSECTDDAARSLDLGILAESGYHISANGDEFPPLPSFSRNPGSGSVANPVHTLNFQNVTIRRSKKKKFDIHNSDSYTPLSRRLEVVDKKETIDSLGLRVSSPIKRVSLCLCYH